MTRNPLMSYVVIKIAILNIILSLILGFNTPFVTDYLALNPVSIFYKGYVWQVFTYMFGHYNFMHLFLNMFVLFMFGLQVEEAMGAKKFLFFYLFCGIGAGLIIFITSLIALYQTNVLEYTLGASAAVYAVFVAFAFYYPDAQILLFFVIPIRAKYMVLLYISFDLYSYMFKTGNISHAGHIGGVIFALIYFLIWGRSSRKGLVSKLVNEVNKKNNEIKERAVLENETQMKKEIISKLRDKSDIDYLTDDEYQFVKYCHIMNENDVSYEGDILNFKEISNKQFISEVRKLIKLD